MTTSRISLSAVLFLQIASGAVRIDAAENPVFKELREKGVALTNGETVNLPTPILPDGLNAADQQAAIAKVVPAGKLKSGFMEGGKSDPWHYKLTDIRGKKEDPKASIGRHIDLYFVAQGKLETVAGEKFMKQQIHKDGQDAKRGKGEFYTDDEIKQRGLKIADEKDFKERYAHILLPLFSMVEVSGTGFGIQTGEKESVLVAFKLDPKFANDPNYPNQWRSLSKDAAGAAVKGTPQPYENAGGYVKVTDLKDQKSPRVFIEYHLVFDEPHGWFNGAATLSSKLPNQYNEDVRQFRFDLKEFEKKNPAKNADQANSDPQATDEDAVPSSPAQTLVESNSPAAAQSAASVVLGPSRSDLWFWLIPAIVAVAGGACVLWMQRSSSSTTRHSA